LATRGIQSLKNKKILITAGPTWVPIDKVRVISNVASGETGVLLAERLQRLGARVTLLLGPAEACCLNKKITLIRFKFFDELKRKISQELKTKKYDIVIHSAAVSDYQLQRPYQDKVKSGLRKWRLNLVPTKKIIDFLKRIDRSLFLVGFKFEPKAKRNNLIKNSAQMIGSAHLDLAVANTINKNQYRAYILDHHRVYGPLLNKEKMAEKLITLIGEYL